MKLGMPYALNEIGGRSNQEDSIFPAKGAADSSSRLFLVCDGMGGHDNGEVASGIVCSTFGSNLANIDHDAFSVDMFNYTLSAAYDALDREDPNPESQRKMGTTLTMLHINNQEVMVAHMGDSRVYHVRPSVENAILYQTCDHSLVNDLVRAEVITAEEAINHPRRNVITRAMQPHLETRHNADVCTINDVQAGDYFFLCSDGILESLSNEALVEILRRDISDAAKMDAIKALCEASSRDNFSAYLVPVVEGLPYVEPIVVTAELVEEAPPQEVEENVTVPPSYADMDDNEPKRSKLTPLNITLLSVAVVAIVITLFIGLGNGNVIVEVNYNGSKVVPHHNRRSVPNQVERVENNAVKHEQVMQTDQDEQMDADNQVDQVSHDEQTEQTEQTEVTAQPVQDDAAEVQKAADEDGPNAVVPRTPKKKTKSTLLNGM